MSNHTRKAEIQPVSVTSMGAYSSATLTFIIDGDVKVSEVCGHLYPKVADEVLGAFREASAHLRPGLEAWEEPNIGARVDGTPGLWMEGGRMSLMWGLTIRGLDEGSVRNARSRVIEVFRGHGWDVCETA